VPLTPKTSLIDRKRSKPAPSKRAKKKKKLTDGQLKKKVWTQFSIFVRARGADQLGRATCVTCRAVKPWQEMQAGHFIRGRLNANLFDERGCHAQCYVCNIHYQGNVVKYYKFMMFAYGEPVIDELLAQNAQTKKWAAGELAELLEQYKELNERNPLTKKEKK